MIKYNIIMFNNNIKKLTFIILFISFSLPVSSTSLTINSAGARYTFRFFTALHFAMAYESRPAKNYISLIKIIPQSHAGQIRPDASFEAEFSGPLDASTVK